VAAVANTEATLSPTADLTAVGMAVGTVAYMSPEQAEGRMVDARSDLFSFGAIAYEMLSGQRAFRAGSTPATLAAVITQEPPPLATIAPQVPAAASRAYFSCFWIIDSLSPVHSAWSSAARTIRAIGPPSFAYASRADRAAG
jgi:serine/threonine protein kinase